MKRIPFWLLVIVGLAFWTTPGVVWAVEEKPSAEAGDTEEKPKAKPTKKVVKKEVDADADEEGETKPKAKPAKKSVKKEVDAGEDEPKEKKKGKEEDDENGFGAGKKTVKGKDAKKKKEMDADEKSEKAGEEGFGSGKKDAKKTASSVKEKKGPVSAEDRETDKIKRKIESQFSKSKGYYVVYIEEINYEKRDNNNQQQTWNKGRVVTNIPGYYGFATGEYKVFKKEEAVDYLGDLISKFRPKEEKKSSSRSKKNVDLNVDPSPFVDYRIMGYFKEEKDAVAGQARLENNFRSNGGVARKGDKEEK